MRLLDRYIGRQLFVTSLFAIAVLSFVLVLGNIFKQLLELVVNKGAPPEIILSFIAYVIPFSLTFTLPWGFLTAVLLVFGRLSADNELTAMRTSGISIPRICAPVGLLAVIFTSICLWINFWVAPQAQESMKTAVFNVATSNPLSFFGSDRVIDDIPGNKIYVEKVEDSSKGNILHNLLIYRLDDDGALQTVMYAKDGRLELAKDEVKDAAGHVEQQFKIVLRYSQGQLEARNEDHPDSISYWKPGITVGAGSMELSLKQLYEKKKKAGGVSTLGLEQLMQSQSPERYVEVNKRISNALATLAFALVGIPLAISAQRKETSVGFAISLAVGLIYFVFFFIADMFRSKPSYHSELLVWVPNVLFFAVGSYRFWKLNRR